MDIKFKKIIFITGVIIVILISGILFKDAKDNLVVSQVLDSSLLNKEITLMGMVSQKLENYISKNNNTYEQFILSDNKNEIRIFCSTKNGISNIRKRNHVIFSGILKQYKNNYEIYGYCNNLKVK